MAQALMVVLGNQLFPPDSRHGYPRAPVFMAEDVGLCTYVKHHKQKLAMFLSAMRSHADALREAGYAVTYHRLDDARPGEERPGDERPDDERPNDGRPYEEKLHEAIQRSGCRELVSFEVEDKFFASRLATFAQRHGIPWTQLPSPMFLTPRATFDDYLRQSGGKPLMANFYRQQRQRMNLLLDDAGRPVGGKWSFDAHNRRSLPRTHTPPDVPPAPVTRHTRHVIDLINARFPDHPGELSLATWWLPTTRPAALDTLHRFITHRLAHFGDYEDAMTDRSPFIYHSTLSPALNLGLITPQEVVDAALQADAPLNAVEGFIRQIIGWREFVRGIYHHYSPQQEQANFFGHTRRLAPCWYTGDTGLPPLDDVIRKALRFGYTHHIERLMVAANLMNLCEVHPHEAHRWFMEMYVDSSDWVMGPNVYGMGLMSDGGLFATKPYLCGSNYLIKMSHWTRKTASPWADTLDGLYWRFISQHRAFFDRNPRLAAMTSHLDRITPRRRDELFTRAQAFIDRVTL